MRQKRQLLRGVLSLLILSELAEGPNHGYALETRINSMIGEKMPRGTVYVILKYLERHNCVESKFTEGKRPVNTYYITENGKSMLKEHIDLLKKVNKLNKRIIKIAEKL